MTSKTSIFSMAGAALFAGAVLVAPAQAEVDAEARSVTVRYADLALGTAEGQAELNKRLHTAARRVCRQGADRSLRELDAQHRCMRLTMKRSETQVASLLQRNALGG